jgi:hypothetical protein
MPDRQIQLRRRNVSGVEQDDFLFESGHASRSCTTALRSDERILALTLIMQGRRS